MESVNLGRTNKVEYVQEDRFYLVSKRILDIFLSIIGLIVFLIPMILIAIAIKIEDPQGTIFFKQQRFREYPRTFYMYKFRSMYSNAEKEIHLLKQYNEMNGPAFKMKNDPRVTKVGRFIRKTSLDELPQLINVLKGDMSIVGPRPAIISEVEMYNEHQKKRLLVKPGITCIWQVSGRNSIGFDEWVELDIKYIQDRCMRLDLYLIIKTIPALLGDDNAH